MQSTDQILPRNFIKTTISARLKCPICFQVYFKPRRLFCGHTFCKPCLKELRDKQYHKNPEHVDSCPLCRTPIDVSKIDQDKFARRIIDELQVSCPVYGCPWKGQCQLLENHYNLECKMKTYVKKVAKGAKQFNFEVEEYQQKDDEIMQKLNQNVQKGSLISRVVSKNPQLMNAIETTPNPEPLRKPKLVTCATQTYPVKVIPIYTTKKPKHIHATVIMPPIGPRIVPVNGFDPIPARFLKKKQKNLATRVKDENRLSVVSSSEQIQGIRQLYNEMGYDFYGENKEIVEVVNESGVVDIDE